MITRREIRVCGVGGGGDAPEFGSGKNRMPQSSLVDGLLAGYGIAIPVGAVAILIVNTSIRYGFAVGWAAGAATADLLYAILASLAGVAISAWLRPLAVPLQILGGLVLVGLAGSGLWRARSRPALGDVQREMGAPLGVYMQFVGITMVNPMTIVYFTALILGKGRAHEGDSLASGLLVHPRRRDRLLLLAKLLGGGRWAGAQSTDAALSLCRDDRR